MKCWNCGEKIKDNSTECPFCGERIKKKNSSKKKENLEKTIAISKVDDDTRRLLDLTLINDIKSEIDKLNKEKEENNKEEIIEEKPEERIEVVQEEQEKDDGYLDLGTNESVKERKRIFFMVGIVAFLLFFIIILLIVFGNRGNNASEEVIKDNNSYESELIKSLDEYYESKEIDGIIYIIENVKNDSEKVERVHDITNDKCKEWLNTYKETLDDNKKEFSESTTNYKNIIEGLNRYAITKIGSSYIRALDNEDYDKFIREVDTVYSDGLGFYDALSYYNKKDYNKAYALLGAIEDTNVFYDKAESYRNKIISNVINLMKKDIVKISKDLDSMSDDGKLNKYIQIEELILKYDNIYTNLNLKSNKDYNSLLNEYRDKIEDLSN
jgi:hypothetical protein